MYDADVIIIGAGITGMTIARQLLRAGKKVLVLEARDRLGGRIHSIHSGDTQIIEGGAEFIHGKLETTLAILKEYGFEPREIGGSSYRVENGILKEDDDFMEHYDLLLEKLHTLTLDMTVNDFLENHFPDQQYYDFKENIKKYVEGYDSADSARASALAFREELDHEDEDQFRVNGGYKALIDAIAKECVTYSYDIRLSAVVKQLKWSKGKVHVRTNSNETFTAAQVVITIPLGVFADETGEGHIDFKPAIKEQMDAIQTMGFGNVIKFVFIMRDSFWSTASGRKHLGTDLNKIGFLFSDAPIPTWWTQYPDKSNIFTGWLAGTAAENLKHADNDTLQHLAVSSLGYIFQMTHAEVEAEIDNIHIANWTAEPFTLGAYAYKTIHTETALQILKAPIENTIFFAGEALYEGVEMGTVEAALKNALEVSQKINNSK